MGVRAKPSSYDIAVVRKAGKGLTMQATSLANRHIRSGVLKNQFVREIDRFEQCLVNDFTQGRKSKQVVLSEMKKEQLSLLEQSALIGSKGIGVVAGAMMVAGGVVTCYASGLTLCALASPVIAHGANNIYENGKYFVDGDRNATGWVRQGYQEVAELTGNDRRYGDVAYYGADLFMSFKGVFGVSNTLKPLKKADKISDYKPIVKISNSASKQSATSWKKYAKSKKLKLFRYSTEDYLKGYQATSKFSLGVEGTSDYYTGKNIYKEVNNDR